MRVGVFIAALLFIPLMIAVKAMRWRLLLQAQGVEYPLGKCIEVYSIGIFWGIVTPGRLGDFVKVLYLKRHGLNVLHGLFSVVGDRLFDFVLLMGLALFSSLVVLKDMEPIVPLIWAAGVGLVFVVGIALYRRLWDMPDITGFITRSVMSEKFGGRQFLAATDPLSFDFKRVILARFLPVVLLTLISWLFFFSQYYVMLSAVGIAASFIEIICSTSLAILTTFLPISIAGIGTRDAVLILLFKQMQMSSESAVVLSLIVLFNYCLSGLLGLGFWLNNPLGKNEKT